MEEKIITMDNVETIELSSLKERLIQGVVEFCFMKKDGTLRHAKGTLVPTYFKVMPKGEKAPNPNVTTYWDIEKDSFRCFKNENFLGLYHE